MGLAVAINLKNKSVVITGTFSAMKRSEVKSHLETLGARIRSAVSSKTDYLVAGDKPGSKLNKAQSLGIPIIGEDDLLELIMPGNQFPFRFYGADPFEFHEGANCGHVYEIRFKQTPDPETRLAIAESFENSIYETMAESCHQPWQWAADWACFNVGEKIDRPSGLTYDDFFSELRDVILAIHQVVALEEVHFLGLDEVSDGDWDQWSMTQAPTPGDAPDWYAQGGEYNTHFGQRQKRYSADIVTDDAFEKARRDAHQRLAASEENEREQRIAAAMDEHRIILVPVEDPVPESLDKVGQGPQAVMRKKEQYDWCMQGPNEYVLFLKYNGTPLFTVMVGDSKGIHPVKPQLKASGFVFTFNYAGDYIWLVHDKDIIEIDLQTGKRQVILTTPNQKPALDRIAGGFAVGWGKQLAFYRYKPGAPAERRMSLPLSVTRVSSFLEGQVLVCHRSDKGTVILGLKDQDVWLLGAARTEQLDKCYEARNGRIICQRSAVIYDDQYLEALNLQGAFDEAINHRSPDGDLDFWTGELWQTREIEVLAEEDY